MSRLTVEPGRHIYRDGKPFVYVSRAGAPDAGHWATPYVLRRIPDGAYVSRPGSEHSYTKNLERAETFPTREAAALASCGNERPVSVDEIMSGPMSKHTPGPWVVGGSLVSGPSGLYHTGDLADEIRAAIAKADGAR